MADSEELDQIIIEQAAEPLVYEAEGVKTTNRSLDELGKAADRARKNEASGRGIQGIQWIKFNRPGPM